MPHYKDGTTARLGDIVRGKGYNIPHEIIGPVVRIEAGSDQCNITVAVAHAAPIAQAGGAGVLYRNGADLFLIRADVEYGQTDAFERIA